MSKPPRTHYRLRTIGGITVVHLMDHNIITDVSDQLSALVEQEEHRLILLNFSHVKGLSSLAIGRLITLKKKLDGLHGQMKLCCVAPDLLELLRDFGLSSYIEIFETQEEALRAF